MDTGLEDRKADFDLAGQMNNCVGEVGAFYTMSFNPAYNDHFDEYRDLEVQVGRSGLTARTNTGYYDQPYFYDQPHIAARRVTVGQLEQTLGSLRGKRDGEVARQLSDLELTEQLSATKLSSFLKTEKADLRGAKARAALVALADASAFLAPPATEILPDPPPDPATQRHMVELADDYLSKTVPKLPNFFATRTTVHYEETPEHYDQTRSSRLVYQPLHSVDTSRATVRYSNSHEIVDSTAGKRESKQDNDAGLGTTGTFGSILEAVRDAIATPGGLTWSRWEKGADGPQATFRYVVPEKESRYEVKYCCLPDREGNAAVRTLTAYHGEIAVDPVSGAILRLMLQADLKPALPMLRSDILVTYGSVVMGAKTYICPVHSISIYRSRTVIDLTEGDASFRVFGPFVTLLNDVTFDNYHVFRSEATVLTGFDPASEKK
jgi:hypothetical protein